MAVTKLTGKQIIDNAIGNQHIADGIINQGKINGLSDALAAKVPTSTTVNGQDLSSNVTLDTDDISEGSNLYFTNARAQAAISVTGAGLSYSDGVIDLTATTTDISEGTNLYFTNTRARDAISAGTGVSISEGAISIGQAVGTSSDVQFKDLLLTGNLTVNGTTITVNAETVNIADNMILLNSDFTGNDPSADAGIEVERGTGNNVMLYWDESASTWKFQRIVSGAATDSTMAYFEGFSGAGGLSYNQGTGQFSISDLGIVTGKLADSAVTSAKIDTGAVGSTQLADGSVVEAKIASNAVTSGKIAAGAVGSTQIADGSVVTVKLSDGSVTSSKIVDGSVVGVKLADGSVTTAKIVDANVTSAKLAADSVITAKILDANVTTAKLADGSVSSTKIANSAVGSNQLADSSVVEAKIAANAVTAQKIASNAILADKIKLAKVSGTGPATPSSGSRTVTFTNKASSQSNGIPSSEKCFVFLNGLLLESASTSGNIGTDGDFWLADSGNNKTIEIDHTLLSDASDKIVIQYVAAA